MARFDYFANRVSPFPPLLLQVQDASHDWLETRVIIPLIALRDAPVKRPKDMMPEFLIEGETYILITTELAAISKQVLGKRLGSLSSHHHRIVSAIDFLLEGF